MRREVSVSCAVQCNTATPRLLFISHCCIQAGLGSARLGSAAWRGFGLDARTALSCLVQQSSSNQAAARVEFLIEDLVQAGLQREVLLNRVQTV